MAAVSTVLMAAAAGASVMGAKRQSDAIQAQGELAEIQSKANEHFANEEAKLALKRGEKAQAQHAKRAKQIIGEQRVGLASQGIDLGSGSASLIQQESYEMSAEDQMTIRNNAWKEAWGLQVQARMHGLQGSQAISGARTAAGTTLLTGIAQGAAYGAQAYGNRGGQAQQTTVGGYGSAGQSSNSYSNYV